MNAGTIRATPRALRVCLWCLLAVVVEIGLYASYRGHDARFHWFTHFFVGASAALAVMLVVAAVTGRPVPVPLVWILVGHLVAMAPDRAFPAAGGNWTWYAVFLLSLGAYLMILDHLGPAPVSPPALVVRRWGKGAPVLLLHGSAPPGATGTGWPRRPAASPADGRLRERAPQRTQHGCTRRSR